MNGTTGPALSGLVNMTCSNTCVRRRSKEWRGTENDRNLKGFSD